MITITGYQELAKFVRAFADGHINMLVICSRGGLGKSKEVRVTLDGQDIVRIGGHVTPLKLYKLLYNGIDKPVVFEEIDGLLANPQHVGLLKQLCETREEKRIMWASADRRALEIDGGAGHFHTKSHVLMLCNSFAVLNANIAALETRALSVEFVPSTSEIVAHIKTFAPDEEITAFLNRFGECIPDLSLRTYVHLANLKQAGMPWQKYALNESTISSKVLEIASLLGAYDNDIERVNHYSGSRRDFYTWKPQAVEHAQRRSQLAILREDEEEAEDDRRHSA